MEAYDEIYMRRCFELASKGLGLTRTNPLVGSVIVHNDRIIGEGYHHEYGGPHAEVNAIRSVKDKSLLKEATIYVNLEPCAHFGKTPPCSTMIVQNNIPRAVICNKDPFPGVSGKGIAAMRNAGIDVEVGVLEREGAFLNRRFLTFQTQKRPYIMLKWAETADGFIDVIRQPDDPIGTNWITNDLARTLVHKWRAEENGLMVGTNTIIADNPKLNVRRWTGNSPMRITFDRNGRIPPNAAILDNSQDTLVFTCIPEDYSGQTKKILIDHDYELEDILKELYDERMLSVMVEGGSHILNEFIERDLWDEARVFRGKMKFLDGIPAPNLNREYSEVVDFHGSELKIYHNLSKLVDYH